MDPLRVIAQAQGVFLTAEAKDLGYDDRSIAAAVRGRLWHRVRRGAFTFVDVWGARSPEQRHMILARAVMRSYGERVALSHVSAALVHGIAVWGVDLSRVHVTRLDTGAGRTEPDVVHHEGGVVDEDLVNRDGMLLVAPVRAAFETATTASSEAALVIFDLLLHLQLAGCDALLSLHLRYRHWLTVSISTSRYRWLIGGRNHQESRIAAISFFLLDFRRQNSSPRCTTTVDWWASRTSTGRSTGCWASSTVGSSTDAC